MYAALITLTQRHFGIWPHPSAAHSCKIAAATLLRMGVA